MKARLLATVAVWTGVLLGVVAAQENPRYQPPVFRPDEKGLPLL